MYYIRRLAKRSPATVLQQHWRSQGKHIFIISQLHNYVCLPQEMLPLILSNNKTRLRKDQNLCFVNATLQVLYSIEDVREIFTADDPSAFPPSWPLSRELSRIFHSAGTKEISASELRRYFFTNLLFFCFVLK